MVDGGPPERIALPWLLQTAIISLSGICAPVALVIALLRYRLFDIDLFQPQRVRLQRAATRLVYGERDEPYAAISRLGQRLESTMAPADILPVIVETVAGALRLPYAAIAVNGNGGLPLEATTGRPPAAEPMRSR